MREQVSSRMYCISSNISVTPAGPREQVNQVTAYLDGSTVYGSTEEELERLREGRGGRIMVVSEMVVVSGWRG